MTEEQMLTQLRQELAMNERVTKLLSAVAKARADKKYRETQHISDPALLHRTLGAAGEVENFLKLITEKPKTVAARTPTGQAR